MTLRKFYLVFTSVIAVFLFITGAFILNYINTSAENTNATLKQDVLGGVMDQFKYSKKPFNVLVLGGDKVNKNSDTIMLVQVDPGKSSISILSIPRDTRVTIDGRSRKINFAYPHGGKELAIEIVRKLTGAQIDFFMFVDTKAFRNIIDILGGVEINVPEPGLKYNDPYQNLYINLKPGLQKLDGQQAEGYMRFRKTNARLTSAQRKELLKSYDGSDLKRIEAQQGFIVELIKQKANLVYLPKVNNVIHTIYQNLETDITQSQIVNVIRGISNFKMENVKMHFLPGEAMSYTPWYYVCDKEKTLQIINQYFLVEGSNSSTTSDLQEKSSDDNSNNSNSNKSNTNKSTTKNNPSNSKSSIKGSASPKP